MITLGSPKDHSSFHSKLAGIFGALCTLEALNLGSTALHCQFACDRKSVLDCIKSTYPVLLTEPHANLLQAVKSKVCQLSIQIEWCHVKGHQDGVTPTILAHDAWLNIEADLLAKETVNPSYHGPIHYWLLGEGWICYIGQQCTVKQLAEKIQVHVNGLLADIYWKKKLWLSDPN